MSSLLFCDVMQHRSVVTDFSAHLSVTTSTVKQSKFGCLIYAFTYQHTDFLICKNKTYTYNYVLFLKTRQLGQSCTIDCDILSNAVRLVS